MKTNTQLPIRVLPPEVINRIAAGEVINRPVNVVKELMENALDAGAKALTIEIKGGGIEFIRITDDGSGIPPEEIRTAFMPHATSKLSSEEELYTINTLGFRGEALSSIAAVAKVELITRQKEALFGSRFTIEGQTEGSVEEIGAPEGTTLLVKDLFFNTPARRKFLKSPGTEASAIGALIEGLALSRPDVSVKFIQDGKVKLQTLGSGDAREVIYRLYGRSVARDLIPIDAQAEGFGVQGFLGLPDFHRSNRNYELYFANGRLIRDKVIQGAIEEGYQGRLMQHKFPFCVLYLEFSSGELDVNVHPAKLEIRLSRAEEFHRFLSEEIKETLRLKETIPKISLEQESRPLFEASIPEALAPGSMPFSKKEEPEAELPDIPEPFEQKRREKLIPLLREEQPYQALLKEEEHTEKLPVFLRPEGEKQESFSLVGQLYQTYWLIQTEGRIYFLDQHAAHEKVNYERLCKKLLSGNVYSQNLLPPLILSLSSAEEETLLRFREDIEALGFVFEHFGARDYALRAVPTELWGRGEKELFLEVLDELGEEGTIKPGDRLARNRIASMACKASVKGGMSMSGSEVLALFSEMMKLEDPFHCPHGRPTLFSMSRQELERKFGRIQH